MLHECSLGHHFKGDNVRLTEILPEVPQKNYKKGGGTLHDSFVLLMKVGMEEGMKLHEALFRDSS
jgi:hypothetical protein